MSQYHNRIYHLKGSPFEIGYAMGQSLGSRLEANIERYVRERVSPGVPFDAERWRSGALPWLRTLPARFQDESEGLVQTHGKCGIPLVDIRLRAAATGKSWIGRGESAFGGKQ